MATQSFQRILEVLDQHSVEFVVVGGVAAVLQGAPVTTFDLDTLVKLDDANVDRLTAALTELEATFRENPQAGAPTKEDVLSGGHLLLMTNCGPLDILGFVGDKQRYGDIQDKVTQITAGGVSLQVIELEELIEQKRALGRPKDQAVLSVLEAVLRHRKRQ